MSEVTDLGFTIVLLTFLTVNRKLNYLPLDLETARVHLFSLLIHFLFLAANMFKLQFERAQKINAGEEVAPIPYEAKE